MNEVKYFVVRYGSSVKGRAGTRSLKRALFKLRRQLRKNTAPPFYFMGHPNDSMILEVAMSRVEKRLNEFDGQPHTALKEVLRGSHYDEPAYVIVKQIGPPLKSALVTALEPWVGKSPYELYAQGPPGPSDCSGTTAYAAEKAYNIMLPHQANQQGHMPDQFFYFTNTDDLQSGDFIFYKYTDRVGSAWDAYDHVDIFVEPGLSIGSRPSTHGIGYYHWINGAGGDRPDWAAMKYGRLGTA